MSEITYIGSYDQALTTLIAILGLAFIMFILFKYTHSSDRSRKGYENMKYAIKMAMLEKLGKEQKLNWERFLLEDYDPFEKEDLLEEIIDRKLESVTHEKEDKLKDSDLIKAN